MDKYIVEGYADKFRDLAKEFDTREEAVKYAKELAEQNKHHSFNVSGPNDIKGLTDHHWKFNKYVNAVVEYCHND
jgi:hypothetical protein